MNTLTSAEKQFDDFIKRFCAKHEISEEEAMQNAIVIEYRNWVVKEYSNDN